MDVLSLALRQLRLESAGYRTLELGAPWRVAFAQRGLRGIHIVVRGRCELVLDGDGARPLLLQAGDVVLAPRADPHVLRSVGEKRAPLISSMDLAGGGSAWQVRAGGTGEATTVVCGAFVFHEADHPALAALPRTIHIPGEMGRAPRWLAPYLDALTAEAFERGPGAEVVMARLSDALIARALRFHVSEAAQPGWLKGLRDPHVAKALGAVHENLGRHWTVASLARVAGLSRSAFAARFAANVGEPSMGYLLRCRMRHAMATLREHGSTLAEVAGEVGYGSEAAFATAFKRHVGVSPGAYRRQKRGDPVDSADAIARRTVQPSFSARRFT